jgi:LETM1 and EF-hand domain-containing protein 1, mitochondrial
MSSGPRIVSNAAARRLIVQCTFEIQAPVARCGAEGNIAYSRLSYSSPLTGYGPRSRFTRDLPPKLSALAIVLPQRNYATETTSHGSGSGPPPGFNIDEAKKPLPKEDGQKSQSSSPTIAELKKSDEQLHVPKTSATATAKTAAIENATLGELAAEKAASTQNEVAVKKEESKKLTLGQKIKKEIQHYWDGTKLLAAEVKISSRLALKMAAGYELSRRENRQVSINTCPFAMQCSR